MDQTRCNPRQEIEEEVVLPAEFIFHNNPEDPEINRITDDMRDAPMEKHGSDQLPGILLSGGGQKIASDPEGGIMVNVLNKTESDPINEE